MKCIASCLLLVSIAGTSGAQAAKSRPAATPLTTAIALFDADKLEPAKAKFTPLAKAGDPEAMFYLGRIAIDQNHGDEAVDWIEEAIKKNDHSSVYYQWLGTAYGIKLQAGNMMTQMTLAPKVKTTMERAVELDSTNVEARVNLAAFYTQAPAMMGGGVDKAREQVAAILRLNPYQGRLQEATLASTVKDTATAERTLRDMATAYPDSSQPVTLLAQYYTNWKRYDDSFRILEERLKRAPNDAGVLYAVGRTGALSGLQTDRAQWALARFLKIPHKRGMQSLAAAHWRLGMVLETKGEKPKAKAEYETALRLDPNLAGAKASLDKLK